MQNYGLLTVRSGSTRLPNKCWLELSGIPVIQYVVNRCRESDIEPIICTTTNQSDDKFENFFFLDCSFPAIVKLSKLGEKRIALRFSEYENLSNVIDNKDKATWVWVDCFSYFPLTKKIEEVLHAHNIKICIVSPELQGQPEKIEVYKNYIKENNILVDAICTKSYNIKLWN